MANIQSELMESSLHGSRKSKKRLVIEVMEETHKAIKLRAGMRNISMRKWVMRAIIHALKQEDSYNQ